MRVYTYQAKPKNSAPQRKKNSLKNRFNWRRFFTWVFRIAALGILLLAVMFLYYSRDLPDPNKLLERDVPESTKIFARDGSLLYEIHGEYRRTLVNLDQISPYLKNATVAIEDKNFYHHPGISLTGILRSAFVDILTRRASQGGSTITQQFVKNAILSKDKSFDRKIREAILAIAIDARFSKDQILKLYLNEIPYGRNAYGIEAASQAYFGKSAKDLDLAESAYLAAMPQAPTFYNPLGPNRKALDTRKNYILAQMREQGYITQQQESDAQNEQVNFSPIKTAISAPHFVLWVQDYLAAKYGEKTLEEGGLKVYTTLDPRLQKIAEDVVKTDVDAESKKYNANNAALVAIDPKTGQILAMVGSKNYFGQSEPAGCTPGKNCVFEPNVNAAVAERQPGSSFKPYVYVTAFGRQFKYAPGNTLFDVITNFGTFNGKDYIPHNYNGSNYGALPIRKALAGSLNVPAVKMLALIGVENAVQTAHNLGITSPLQNCGLSLVLGGCEVKLLDHVAAFSVFADGGIKNEKTPILKIEDKNGNVLEQFQSNPQQVLDPEANYELVNILTDNNARSFIFGAHSPLILSDRTVAAKTGTTQNWHDGWTIGFTPSLAAGVWAGNNDGTLLKKGADGVVVAAPIWHDFMQQALAGTPPEDFPKPSGIKEVTVDDLSGKLPTEYSPSTRTDIFADYAVPTDYDDMHLNVAFDAQTGQPATALTPPDQIVNKVITKVHSEKPDNPNWEAPVIAWAEAAGLESATDVGTSTPETTGGSTVVSIINPSDGSTITRLPFQVLVTASSQNPIARVDLSVDGQFFQSLTTAPYAFTIDKSLSEGDHTLAATAVDTSGASNQTSIGITIMLNAPALQITEPADGSSDSFPLTLTAESPNLYGTVTFFSQENRAAAKVIGIATNISHTGDRYQYSFTWTNPPPNGTYHLYAQADSGAVSPKIKVILP